MIKFSNQFQRYRYIVFGIVIAVLVVTAALVGNRSTDSIDDESHISQVSQIVANNANTNQKPIRYDGYALYINGEIKIISQTREYIEQALNKAVHTQISAEFDEYNDYTILDKVYIASGLYRQAPVKSYDDVLSAINDFNFTLSVQVAVLQEEVIPSVTIYQDDVDLSEGNEKTQREGSDGLLLNTYLNTFVNGVFTGTELVDTTIITQAEPTVIVRGVKTSDSSFMSIPMFIVPYDGRITSEYGYRNLFGKTFHGGLDLAGKGKACNGDPIMAAGDGVIINASFSGEFGNLIIIEHNNGVRTYYAHLSKMSVRVGDKVERGEYIGNIGATGLVTGPHLHFEVRMPTDNGSYERADPRYYLIGYDKLPK